MSYARLSPPPVTHIQAPSKAAGNWLKPEEPALWRHARAPVTRSNATALLLPARNARPRPVDTAPPSEPVGFSHSCAPSAVEIATAEPGSAISSRPPSTTGHSPDAGECHTSAPVAASSANVSCPATNTFWSANARWS